jgi:hypothetical protein
MDNIINWNDIITECGDYKEGFVAVFRRYENQPTDERDALGRTVKVTARSFAVHMGIDPSVFRNWLKNSVEGRSPQPRPISWQKRDVTRTATAEPTAVVDGIMAADTKTQDAIYHELKLRRAGIDTSEAGRKASVARTHQALEPVRRALASTGLVLCVQALTEAQEYLQKAISEGAATEEAMAPVNAAFEAFSFTLAEARFAVS